MNVPRIYLDLCCFNRPYDDQAAIQVRLETEAKLHLQDLVRQGTLELAWSAVLDLENQANPYPEHRIAISQWRALSVVDVSPDGPVEALAEPYVAVGIHAMDALHLACALASGANYFVTTDKRVLKRAANQSGLMVLSPIDLIRILSEPT
jgi:predicted nucleic acid-binding protein